MTAVERVSLAPIHHRVAKRTPSHYGFLRDRFACSLRGLLLTRFRREASAIRCTKNETEKTRARNGRTAPRLRSIQSKKKPIESTSSPNDQSTHVRTIDDPLFALSSRFNLMKHRLATKNTHARMQSYLNGLPACTCTSSSSIPSFLPHVPAAAVRYEIFDKKTF